MAKRKKKATPPAKKEPLLSEEMQEGIDHFFSCFPPKHFSRNLRNMSIDLIELNNGLEPLYLQELFMQLSLFFPLLDLIEDEGNYHSEDYEHNREFY
jgi:hypothetical protein